MRISHDAISRSKSGRSESRAAIFNFKEATIGKMTGPPAVLLYVAFLVLIFASSLLKAESLRCKNENNQDVDWYVLYKIPRIQDSKNRLIRDGVAYMYMDSTSFDKGWILSKKDITTNDSIPAYTLAPFYDDKNAHDLLWLLYNDQAPNQEAKFDNGHTKGALIANDKEGFWLVHSVPNFPPQPNSGVDGPSTTRSRRSNGDRGNKTTIKSLPTGGYAYPPSGKVNGQSFLCVSTSQGSFNAIGKQLMYNQILVYRKNTPSSFFEKYPALINASKQMRIDRAPFNNKVSIASIGGEKFVSFAKGSKWGKDLYDNFVAPELKADLYAETWLNGRGKLPSDCSGKKVINIESISLPQAEVEFKSSHDHSKWAVAANSKDKSSWVCVGDINRANTQFDRGGGTVCFNLPEVWQNYRNSVKDLEPCPKKGFLQKYNLTFTKVLSYFGYKTD